MKSSSSLKIGDTVHAVEEGKGKIFRIENVREDRRVSGPSVVYEGSHFYGYDPTKLRLVSRNGRSRRYH